MNTYAKIILRQNFTKTDGTKPIYLRVTIGRIQKYFNLNVSVHPDSWDTKKFMVRKNYPNANKINLITKNAINKAEKILFDYSIQGKQISEGEFERNFLQSEVPNDSFYEYAESVIQQSEKRFSFYTLKSLKSHLRKFKRFSTELSMADLTYSFIKSYDNYMLKQGNSENTRFKSMAVLKSFINKAIKDGHIKENPFKMYPIGKKAGNKEFLTIEELKILETYFNNGVSIGLKNTLRYFLFSCYTGLRYQDIKKLRHCKISDNMITLIITKEIDFSIFFPKSLIISSGIFLYCISIFLVISGFLVGL